ncbi:MAG: 50S ribosomal protein L19 [Candidatus Gribaldobacteria bacterium]|nr:50S ribosomal protein L19 [Candidatus Gribaldobacteria bacterium]
MQNTSEITKQYLKTDLPNMKVGDIIKVHQKIPAPVQDAKGKKTASKKEGARIQVFEGIILAMKHGKGVSGSFTVRRVIAGVGVERIFPLHSPAIEKIEIVGRSKTRRAKLYYLRNRVGKKAKLKRTAFVPETPKEISEEDAEDTTE